MTLPRCSAPPLSRRSVLGAMPALMLAGRAVAATPPDSPAQNAGLHARARGKNMFFGTALDDRVLHSDRAYMAQVPKECGVLTGEEAFKWSEIHPAPTRYSWGAADRLLRFAGQHGMQVRGHTLLWHEQNPKWVQDTLSPANAEQILTQHIKTVCGHFRHRLMHWDVANEVLWPKDGKPGAMRDSIWYRALGPHMLDVAFHACAEADPGAMRFINDFGMEYSWQDNQVKRQAMLNLLSDLQKRNVPVQGVGLQAHLEAGVDNALDAKMLHDFCDSVAAMGLKVAITELDVRDNRLPAGLAERDAAVAHHAQLFLEIMLAHPAVIGVVGWGLSDRRTWLNDDLPRADGLPQRPLPLDTEMVRKPLWAAIANSFDSAPARP